jgi:RNA polymerase sigma-70 factor, ECF subfamily
VNPFPPAHLDPPGSVATAPLDAVPDDRLAAGVRAGDAAAFEQLFQSYYRRLYVFVESYVRAPEVAEDLTVDVFVRIWERREGWELRGSLRAYLYAAARNEALAWLRRQRMVQRVHDGALHDDCPPGMGAPPAPGDAAVQARELAEAVEQAIGRLPERGREALVLHRQHGLSYAEVGEAMGISPRTVEVHIRRAFQALRDELVRFLPLLLSILL